MRTRIYNLMDDIYVDVEILVMIYDTSVQPLEALVQDDRQTRYHVWFEIGEDGVTTYGVHHIIPRLALPTGCAHPSHWILTDQYPWDERRHIYSALPLRGEDDSAIDVRRGALMGWVVLDEDWLEFSGDPFATERFTPGESDPQLLEIETIEDEEEDVPAIVASTLRLALHDQGGFSSYRARPGVL